MRRRKIMWGQVMLNIGVIVILEGKFVGIMKKIWILEKIGIRNEEKKIIEIVEGGIEGMMEIIGERMMVNRRMLEKRVRD